ncbi:FKBP-type peptidyl-prolyl cis-trans isomerase [Calditrichota bacterium]
MKRLIIAFVVLASFVILQGCGVSTKKEDTTGSVPDMENEIKEGTLPDLSKLSFTKTKSGLEYTDLKSGEGMEADKGHKVTVHYHGWLISGRRFDSSLMKKEPFSFELGAGKVIRGWDEGVQGMQEGTQRILRIPSKLGYGSTGFPGAIPPNAPLIFYVKLLKIE